MRKIGILLLAGTLLLTGCSSASQPGARAGYQSIDQATARQMMEQEDSHLVVDVRRLDEFESGHIPGAICIPNEEIGDTQPQELPNPNQILLLYCRSGNRSRQAAEKLIRLGYTQVYDFGGINDWTGDIVTGQAVLLTVKANPTTGFDWTAEQDGTLFLMRDYYIGQVQSKPVSGSGGWHCFVLTPTQPGKAQVSFRYSRSWEPSDIDPQFTCVFDIAEDLSISISDDGAAEAAERGFKPVIRIY